MIFQDQKILLLCNNTLLTDKDYEHHDQIVIIFCTNPIRTNI
jgi:hypothetical protein